MAEPRRTGGLRVPRVRAGGLVALALVVVLAAVGAWFGAAVLGDTGLAPQASEEGRYVGRVWRVMLGLAGGVSGVVLGLLIVALVDGFRRRHGPEPEQSAGNMTLELVYTAIPLALVAVVFVIALQGTDRLDAEPPDDALRVTVTGFQWGWQFEYDLEGGAGPSIVGTEEDQPELVLPIDRTVALDLVSRDVIHSFFTPAFRTKLDVIPGRDNQLVVTPNRLGTFAGHCAEFCGLDHARMNFTVRVVTAEQFDEWVASERALQGGDG